jgi:hypothetical protein
MTVWENPMASRKAIDAGLTAHDLWKNRLHDAIEHGTSEFTAEVVGTDNACAFGAWLYSLPEAERESEPCKNILALHARFHRTAAEILALALKGNRKEALAKLAYGGVYSFISGKLVLELHRWKEAL